MRIRLKEGKQKEILTLAKGKGAWKELSKKLDVSEGYLKNDVRIGYRLLSEESYDKICKILGKNFDDFIVEKLSENWGRAKGGTFAKKRTKEIKKPKKDENLAEVIGIILGDGHVSEFIRGKKIRNYFIKIAGNADTDLDYIQNYIPSLFEKVFSEKGKVFISKKRYVGYFTLYGKNYVSFMKSVGINSGNKKVNNQGIPDWIKTNRKLLKRCLRGLIDTDGSVHTISRKNLNIRIDYTSYIPQLINDVRNSFIMLGFSPSKVINERHFFLSKQDEIKKYVKEIGFANQKNLNRLKNFQKNAPVVQRPRMQPSQRQSKTVLSKGDLISLRE